jgi:hypothetical protein
MAFISALGVLGQPLYHGSGLGEDDSEGALGRSICKKFNTVVVLRGQVRVKDEEWRESLSDLVRCGQVKELHLMVPRSLILTGPPPCQPIFHPRGSGLRLVMLM